MHTQEFTPDITTVGSFTSLASISDLAEEQGVYSASPEFVKSNCGPIANSILDQIPDSFYTEADEAGLFVNIDVRVHRLYKGDYPAYPGWHCDGEYRETYKSQPDLSRVVPHKHLVGTVSTEPDGVSLTQFVSEPVTVTIGDVSEIDTLWGQVHNQIEQLDPATVWTADGDLTQFGSFTLHRATPAVTRGWRLFFRASMWHKPYLGDGGMISRQEQIYQILEGKGW